MSDKVYKLNDEDFLLIYNLTDVHGVNIEVTAINKHTKIPGRDIKETTYGLIDTGCTVHSGISEYLAKKLKLKWHERLVPVKNASSKNTSELRRAYTIDLVISGKVFKGITVIEFGNMKDRGMLIGLDIIKQCTLHITDNSLTFKIDK